MKNDNRITPFLNGFEVRAKCGIFSVDTIEEANLILAIQDLLVSENKDVSNLSNMLPYAFRVIGSSSKWT